MQKQKLFIQIETTSEDPEKARIYKMDLMYLEAGIYCDMQFWLNPDTPIDSKIVEKRGLEIKQEELKKEPYFAEITSWLIPQIQRAQVLVGFDILETARMLKKEFNKIDPKYNFELTAYDLVDPLLVFKDQVKYPDQIFKLYCPDKEADNLCFKAYDVLEQQEELHKKFFEEGYDYVQLKTIGDPQLSGKWFEIRLDDNRDKAAYFKQGKYRNQIVDPSNNEHLGYVKWLLKNIGTLTKDEKQFIGLVVKGGQ